MQEFTTIRIPSTISSSVIERKALQFTDKTLSSYDIIQHANDIKPLPYSIKLLLEVALEALVTKEYKISFLTYLVPYYSGLLDMPNDGLIYASVPVIEEVLFEITQQLSLNGVSINGDAFTVREASEADQILSQILNELEILKAGNVFLSDQINELEGNIQEIKGSMVLGKKTFNQRMTGVVASYVATKGADEVFDTMKPHLGRLLYGGFEAVTRFLSS